MALENVNETKPNASSEEEELSSEELEKVSGGVVKHITGDPCEGGEVFHP
jgi:hypothetical protein